MKGRLWRKALTAALALLIVSGSVPIQPFTGVFDAVSITANAQGTTENLGGYNFTKESDNEGDYYKIDCPEALNALAAYVNAGNTASGMRFKQTADIDMDGVNCTPIGKDENHRFSGIYDGSGYKISNFRFSTSNAAEYAGLFGYACGAEITHGNYEKTALKNIVLEGCDIRTTADDCYAAGICGIASSGYANIDNCRVSGTISGRAGAGGITIYSGSSVYVTNCFTDVTLTADERSKYNPRTQKTEKYLPVGKIYAYMPSDFGSAHTQSNYYHDTGDGVGASGNSYELTAAQAAPLYTVTGSGLAAAAAGATVTFGDNAYFAANATVTLTTGIDHIISGTPTVSGTGAALGTVAANKQSMTVTIGAADATVSAACIAIAGSCGTNATWRMSDANNDGTYETLSIEGGGKMADYASGGSNIAPWRTDFAAGITAVNISNGITGIGSNAFNGCSRLARVDYNYEGDVVNIPSNAFYGCHADLVIVVPTPAIAVQHKAGTTLANEYKERLRVPLGSDYLFRVTGTTAADAAYQIADADDLRRLANAVNARNGNATSGQTFRQTADIDLGGTNFPMIGADGASARTFQGTYDGQGFAISGLSISTDNDTAGLFRRINRATLRGIILVQPSVTTSKPDKYYTCSVGAIVGYAAEFCTIENCHALQPTVSATGTGSGAKYLGAIVGEAAYGNSLTNCCYYGGNAAQAMGYGSAFLTRVGPARKVTLGSGLASVSPALTGGDGSNGFRYGGNDYYREGVELTLTSDVDTTAGYTLTYSVNGTARSGETYTVNSTDGDVTLTANFAAIPWTGNGTRNDPYIIKYPSQLDLLAQRVNSGTGDDYAADGYSYRYFKLAADIEYTHTTAWNDTTSTEENFTAIGCSSKPFKGNFNGDGHTISGIRIYKGGNSDSNHYQGLFGYTRRATVENVILADARITGCDYTGGIVGNSYNGTVKNCHALSNVTVHAVHDYASSHGGIAGQNYDGTVTGCTSAAAVTFASGLVNCQCYGGIIGHNNGYSASRTASTSAPPSTAPISSAPSQATTTAAPSQTATTPTPPSPAQTTSAPPSTTPPAPSAKTAAPPPTAAPPSPSPSAKASASLPAPSPTVP